ncbi:MAG TPA: hypothetical protein VK508_08400 [Cyclobacteriaceae bacterium]|nr:hypothetical protein [Cyclobacteriaceae bacterium]
MKKILTLSLVLLSTVMFANGTDDKNPSASASGSAVIKNGESTFRVIYKSEKENDVKVSILDDRNRVVYSEKVSNTDGFSRPYNFASLNEGDYTISIEDGTKKTLEKVSYRSPRNAKMLNVLKVTGNEGKYLITAAGKGAEVITVSIYDGTHTLIHRGYETTSGDFAKVYNVKSVKGHLTFEIANANGEVKTVSY